MPDADPRSDELQAQLDRLTEAHAELAARINQMIPATSIHHVREQTALNRAHLTVSGLFQSQKYRWAPAGYLPLKIGDPLANDLITTYAVRRSADDPQFAEDVMEALRLAEKRETNFDGP